MRILRLTATLALWSTAIFANPSACPTPPGSSVSLSSLPASTGCTELDNIFTNFVVNAGSGNTLAAPTADDVFILATGTTSPPVTDAIFNTPGPGPTWSVPGGGSGELDSTVSYVANLDPNQTTFDYVGLSLSVGGTTGTALIIVTETYCVGATTTDSCNTGTSGSLTAVFNGGVELVTPTPVAFAPTSQTVAITDEIIIFNSGGDGSIGTLDNGFEEFQTPEPSTFLLFGSALTLLALVRTRKSV